METSWIKASFDEEPPWEIRELPGRGYAAFALRRFDKGDLIMSEMPTVWVHGHHPFDKTQLAEIEDKVGALPEADQKAFYEMANVFPEAPSAAAGIFMTNCFDMTDSPHGDACAMYLAIARLNHSCSPNAQQTHIPDTGAEVLHACRTIEVGEEINDCYIELRQSREDRRKDLREIYRFNCGCSSCEPATGAQESSQEVSEEDKRRQRAKELDNLVIEAATEDGPEVALQVAIDALRLLKAENNLHWSIRYIPDAHSTVAQLANSCNSRSLAREHAKFAYEMSLLLQGPSSPDTIASKKAARL